MKTPEALKAFNKPPATLTKALIHPYMSTIAQSIWWSSPFQMKRKEVILLAKCLFQSEKNFLRNTHDIFIKPASITKNQIRFGIEKNQVLW
jgi:hypothetical protein